LPDVDAVRDEGDDSHLPATEGAQHALPLHASGQRGGNQFCGLQRKRFVPPIDAHRLRPASPIAQLRLAPTTPITPYYPDCPGCCRAMKISMPPSAP
jgi:hypothetical protein